MVHAVLKLVAARLACLHQNEMHAAEEASVSAAKAERT